MKVVWFRSDLRVHDNPALLAASKTAGEKVKAVFYITKEQWVCHGWGKNKIGFVLANVMALQEELAKLNINLEILCSKNFKTLSKDFIKYLLKNKCSAIYYNKEYELNENIRDNVLEKLLKNHNISCHNFDDQCLIAPKIIFNKQNSPYTVFTPFKKACYQYLAQNQISILPKPKKQEAQNFEQITNNLPKDIASLLSNDILKQWVPGEKQAIKLLNNFCQTKLSQYKKERDFPSNDGTSSLSPYFAAGVLSVRLAFVSAIEINNYEFSGGNEGVACWISELIWRDFYRHIIVHFPEICKGKNFNKKYDNLKWLPVNENFDKWKNGQTGIPIIDAAMRQLVSTGWMHNRLRMVVAMFLTKNLLIDWRHGEKFFSEHLIDLDFASNNGGWQWSASTGTDAVPYFRVFNPITQSIKFDPAGYFIRHYCPELNPLNLKQIHDPSSYLNQEELNKINYPNIIVDLAKSRLRALHAFKSTL